ncbi:flavodoxin family protein [Desulfovibrio sp. OttesenSCG-928-I05]|nr:flavodoxin family protein [Desulfovibrio sp. OttesenSCG-928-I05]
MAACLVVYSSVTGNTRMVAEAVREALPEGTLLCPVKDAPAPDAFDFIALGFWVHRAGPDPRMTRYMASVRGKDVAFFGTLAAYPDSDHAQKVRARAADLLEGNTILGSFLCQGKLAQKRFEKRMADTSPNSGHPMTPERRARLLEAARHPDTQDLENARALFRSLYAAHGTL